MRNGLSVVVRITDRGPYIRGRVIDLSLAAARAIGAESDGVVPVMIELLAESSEGRAALAKGAPGSRR
jgi:rare lipoprotein A